jgi:hypothetical protein
MAQSSSSAEHLAHLHEQLGKVLAVSTQGQREQSLRKAQGAVVDLDIWLTVLRARGEGRPLSMAFREYASALLLASMGLYGPAFYGLRHFLEVSLGSVLLSSNELALRLWVAGKRDLTWADTVDDDKGVFSNLFVQAFCEPLEQSSTQLGALAKKIYRECSEFVHGNPPATARLPSKLEFSDQLFEQWIAHADSAVMIVQSALVIRYLTSLGGSDVSTLDATVRDALGHHAAIRAHLDHHREGQ